MTNLDTVNELRNEVKESVTYESEGRNVIAKNSTKLYHIIEDALYEKYGVDAITDAHNDLCKGNFAEPFMCEQQKGKFELYRSIYIKIIK